MRLEDDNSVIARTIDAIQVRGARTHNLQNVDVNIPLGKLTVITGVSGSGKSSLAIDTIFAAGRHRYFSSLSNRSRELMQRIDPPEVESIDYLPPVLHIEQPHRSARKRSTVATISEVHEFLRLMFARVGVLHCPECGTAVTSQSRSAIVQRILQCPERQKIVILAPIVRAETGSHADVFARIIKEGFVRARVDGVLVDAGSPPEIFKSERHDIEIVIDRLILKAGVEERLEESVDLALQLGQGQCVISVESGDAWDDQLYSTQLVCPNCLISYPAIEPRTFSFNSGVGACPACQGLGISVDSNGLETPCPDCAGKRLGPLARSILIAGVSIVDFCGMRPSVALDWIQVWLDQAGLKDQLDDDVAAMIRFVIPEIQSRLQFLVDVGLDYLTIDRNGDSLSFGEFQRTRLAGCLGNQLTGVCYILDEPTAGLHARDLQRLLKILIQLRDDGNTVILVEHDLEVIRQADHLIELGPAAGRFGGKVTAEGTPAVVAANPVSVTGPFLQQRIETPGDSLDQSGHRPIIPVTGDSITLCGATLHNLKNVTVQIPLQQIVVVTGVSGSGKSSLIMQTLVPAVRRELGEKIAVGGPFTALTGFESLQRVIRIDQSPLGRSDRSSPATYTGIWPEIRQIFSKTKEARVRGFHARNFSLTEANARCQQCSGRGTLPVDEKQFSNWSIVCPVCSGRRFSPAVLSIRYRGLNVADVLDLTFEEAEKFFQNFKRIHQIMSVMIELGLGYLKLGQPASTLSGGEAQRVKLSTELAKSGEISAATLFVLDEPTSGLHAADIQRLVDVLRRLKQQGHSVLVVEHNQQFIHAADWMIEVGPTGGESGGAITFAGPISNY